MTSTRHTVCAETIVNHEGRDMLAFVVAIPGGDPWPYRSAVCDNDDLRGGPYAVGGNSRGASTPREAWRQQRDNVRMYGCADRAAGNRCAHWS